MQTKLHKNLKIAELPPLKIALILNFMLQLNILSRYFKLILHQTPALSNTAASRSKGSSNDWGCDFQTTTKTKPSEVEMSKKRQGDTTLASSKAARGATGVVHMPKPGKTPKHGDLLPLLPPHSILQNPSKTAVLPVLPPTVLLSTPSSEHK